MNYYHVIGVYESQGDHWDFLGYFSGLSKNKPVVEEEIENARQYKSIHGMRCAFTRLLRKFPRYYGEDYKKQPIRFECLSIPR